jgi:hypothetical protein|nr:MAG TPA: Aminoglycoside-2''-adenylyltransferase [Crassvirales sp.]
MVNIDNIKLKIIDDVFNNITKTVLTGSIVFNMLGIDLKRPVHDLDFVCSGEFGYDNEIFELLNPDESDESDEKEYDYKFKLYKLKHKETGFLIDIFNTDNVKIKNIKYLRNTYKIADPLDIIIAKEDCINTKSNSSKHIADLKIIVNYLYKWVIKNGLDTTFENRKFEIYELYKKLEHYNYHPKLVWNSNNINLPLEEYNILKKNIRVSNYITNTHYNNFISLNYGEFNLIGIKDVLDEYINTLNNNIKYKSYVLMYSDTVLFFKSVFYNILQKLN